MITLYCANPKCDFSFQAGGGASNPTHCLKCGGTRFTTEPIVSDPAMDNPETWAGIGDAYTNGKLEERARELAGLWRARFCEHWRGAYCRICTAADLSILLAQVQAEARLAEAKWWHDAKKYLGRIAVL